MYEGKTVAVVVPDYNEERLIGRVIETMPHYVDRIVVVDDASKDSTIDVVSEYQDRISDRLVLLEHDTNQGVGGAIAGAAW